LDKLLEGTRNESNQNHTKLMEMNAQYNQMEKNMKLAIDENDSLRAREAEL
jgi:hypothetical protein